MASVGLPILGSGTSSRRMSPTPWNTTAFMRCLRNPSFLGTGSLPPQHPPWAASAGLPLEHLKWLLGRGRRKAAVDRGQLLVAQHDVQRGGVGRDMLGRTALGIAITPGCARTQARATWNGSAPWRWAMSPSTPRVGSRPCSIGRVRHHGMPRSAAPGQQVPLGAAPGEVVEHLVGRTAVAAGQPTSSSMSRRRSC